MRPQHKFSWQQQYFDAMSDLTAVTLQLKISAARSVLDERVAELLICKGHDAERLAILDALFSLRVLEMYTGQAHRKSVTATTISAARSAKRCWL